VSGTRVALASVRWVATPAIPLYKDVLAMNRSYSFLLAILFTGAVSQVAQAHPPGPASHGAFGSGPVWLGLFPHIHQHGPLYNYGPYYGYPPFEPYGPWTANLQYNPAYSGIYSHPGRIAEDKSGHGGLLTQWGGGGFGLGAGLGLRSGGGFWGGGTGAIRGTGCPPSGWYQGLGLRGHRNTSTPCSASTAPSASHSPACSSASSPPPTSK
jgi:hypothetical protein